MRLSRQSCVAWHDEIHCIHSRLDVEDSSSRKENVEILGYFPLSESRNRLLIEIQQISRLKGIQNQKKGVCNLGNLENTFVMTASKRVMPFLLVDQTDRLDTGLAEKLRWLKWCYLWRCSRKTDRMKVITTVRIILGKRSRKVPFMSIKRFLQRLTVCKLY